MADPGSHKPELADGAYFGSSLSLQFFCPLIQFVCVESLVTALVDMYPRVFRKKNRREVLILGVSVTSFLVGLVMLTEVRVCKASGWGSGAKEERRWTAATCQMEQAAVVSGNWDSLLSQPQEAQSRQVPPLAFGH